MVCFEKLFDDDFNFMTAILCWFLYYIMWVVINFINQNFLLIFTIVIIILFVVVEVARIAEIVFM